MGSANWCSSPALNGSIYVSIFYWQALKVLYTVYHLFLFVFVNKQKRQCHLFAQSISRVSHKTVPLFSGLYRHKCGCALYSFIMFQSFIQHIYSEAWSLSLLIHRTLSTVCLFFLSISISVLFFFPLFFLPSFFSRNRWRALLHEWSPTCWNAEKSFHSGFCLFYFCCPALRLILESFPVSSSLSLLTPSEMSFITFFFHFSLVSVSVLALPLRLHNTMSLCSPLLTA